MQRSLNLASILIPLIKEDKEGAFKDIEGLAYTASTTQILKSVVGEKRPEGNSHKSFPSGHASASFQAATFLQLRYGYKYGIPSFIVATLVAYSRVQAKRHYWHDVIAGAMLGAGFSYLVQRTKYSLYNLAFAPTISGDRIGFLLTMNFKS